MRIVRGLRKKLQNVNERRGVGQHLDKVILLSNPGAHCNLHCKHYITLHYITLACIYLR